MHLEARVDSVSDVSSQKRDDQELSRMMKTVTTRISSQCVSGLRVIIFLLKEPVATHSCRFPRSGSLESSL